MTAEQAFEEWIGVSFSRHKLNGSTCYRFAPRALVFIDDDVAHGRDFHRWAETVPWYQRCKIRRTMHRDLRIDQSFERDGWDVTRLWKSQVLCMPEVVCDAVRRHVTGVVCPPL